MQFQADILNVPIVRPTMLETTALGAGLLAGLATGVWDSRDEAKSAWTEDRRFTPTMPDEDRAKHLASWQSAVERA
jgi:glycerol kinase